MNIRREDFSFTSPVDGVALQGTYLFPDEPKGIVQFVHGMAEHRARYLGIMTYLAEQGYATVIHDHRGHGTCELTGYFGKGGKEGMIRDTYEVTRLAKEKFGAVPFWLFGHSMGSLVARCYLKRYDGELTGLFLSGSPYAPPIAIRAAQGLIAVKSLFQGDRHRSHMVNGLVTGAFNKAIKDPASPNQWISYNEENVAAYDADDLCGFCFTLSGFRGLMGLMAEAGSQKNWAKTNLTLPIYLISGEDDPCHGGKENLFGIEKNLQSVGYQQTEVTLYPNMRHEILMEDEKETVYAAILEKLQR